MITKFKIFENVTPKTNIEEEIDRILDKGYNNLTSDEKYFLKNTHNITKKYKSPIQKIDNYYDIAQEFFKKIIGTDIKNYKLDDNIDLFDIMNNEDEVIQVVNMLYYIYNVQIDPEVDNDYKLLNIFKKISMKTK